MKFLMWISLFITCYNDTLFPNTGKAVVAVLERLGHEVGFRQAQTCCGQMHFNTGSRSDAVQLMRRFVEVYRDAEVMCIPSTSCVAMIRDNYPAMPRQLGESPLENDVKELVSSVYNFAEVLTDKLDMSDVGAFFPQGARP